MSELITRNGRNDLRLHLLATVSALALAGLIGPRDAKADDDPDRPTIWIELGGQLERVDSAQTIFAPPFVNLASPIDRDTMTGAQLPSLYAIGGEGQISFEPEGMNWVFTADVRYGRSNSAKHPHYQGPRPKEQFPTINGNSFGGTHTPVIETFGDGQASSGSTHLIADFKAGKDVGLGLFGAGGSSVVSAGVRFAQFSSRSDVTLNARPIEDIAPKYHKPGGYFSEYKVYQFTTRSFSGVFHAERNTHAIGPTLSWDASALIAGTDNGAGLAFDWGVNAAVLFGKQRARTHHQTHGSTHTGFTVPTLLKGSYSTNHPTHVRARNVTIPNVGGFAGVSLKFPNAKISLGYRADFFFGAMDSGIDTARNTNVGFYGPFATVSIGVP
jgi:hypothetical protein